MPCLGGWPDGEPRGMPVAIMEGGGRGSSTRRPAPAGLPPGHIRAPRAMPRVHVRLGGGAAAAAKGAARAGRGPARAGMPGHFLARRAGLRPGGTLRAGAETGRPGAGRMDRSAAAGGGPGTAPRDMGRGISRPRLHVGRDAGGRGRRTRRTRHARGSSRRRRAAGGGA